MIALDTNVLVRIIVKDPNEQAQTGVAKSLLKSSGQVYLPQIVQVETVGVLESAYGFDKEAIVKALEHLKEHNAFKLQHPESFGKALNFYRDSNADFSDCLILIESQEEECELATFDRKLGKLIGARHIAI